MLLTAKSFSDFVINAWSFPRKNVNFLTQKLKPVEGSKVVYVTRVDCQYFPGILSYLEDSFSYIQNEGNAFDSQINLLF